jgi:hypothetical protein
MAWSIILSVYGAHPIAEVKLFSVLHFTISCRLVFKHLLNSCKEYTKLSKNKIVINFFNVN